MKTIVKAAAIAALMATTAFGAAKAADINVTFDPGTVAYGYSDGYWYRHDRDATMGLRGEIRER